MHARSTAVDVTEGGEAGPLRQMVVGLKTIAADRAARVLVAFCALVSFVYGTDTVLFIAASDERLGRSGRLRLPDGRSGRRRRPGRRRQQARVRAAARLVIILGLVAYCLPTAALTVVEEPVVASRCRSYAARAR